MSPTLLSLLLTTTASIPIAVDADPQSVLHSPLPEICLATPEDETVQTARRRRHLLPTVSFGLDYQPRVDAQSQRTDAHRLYDGPYLAPDDARHRHDDSHLKRWTLSLRWNRGRSADEIPRPHSRLEYVACTQLRHLGHAPPSTLREGVDRWAEISRFQALLPASKLREVRHD